MPRRLFPFALRPLSQHVQRDTTGLTVRFLGQSTVIENLKCRQSLRSLFFSRDGLVLMGGLSSILGPPHRWGSIHGYSTLTVASAADGAGMDYRMITPHFDFFADPTYSIFRNKQFYKMFIAIL